MGTVPGARGAWSLRGLGAGLDLVPDPRGLDTQEAGRAARQPPVPAAEEGDRGRREDAADERGVEQDSAAQRGREHLHLGARPGAHGDEGEAEDERGARDEPPGATDALDDRGLRRTGTVEGLAHPADDEDL